MAKSLPKMIANSILADYIDSGRVERGGRLPSIRDLQDVYSTSTVTLVQAIGLLEQWGIVEKKHGKGCYVKHTLEDTSQSHGNVPNMLGFIVPTTASSAELLMRTYTGVEKTCRRHGYHVVIMNSNSDYDTERKHIQSMMNMGCKGIVLYPTVRSREQLEHDYLKTEFADFPLVLVDMAYPEQGHSQVVFDNYHAGYEITSHLLKQGYKRVFIMKANSTEKYYMHQSFHERFKGYADALADWNIPVDPANIVEIRIPTADDVDDLVLQEVTRIVSKIKDEPEIRTGLIAIQDIAAVSAISLARELGIRIPDHLKVVGFDNLSSAQSFTPEFDTTCPDFERAGSLAAQILINQVREQKKRPVIYLLDVPVKHRKSVSSR